MADTLFAFFKGAVSNADDTDPESSSNFYNPPLVATHNVTKYRRETVPLDDGDTRTVSMPDGATGDWVGFAARVVGEAKLTTVGVNWNGSSGVTGVTVGYGVERYPGYISMTTANLSTMTLEGLADDTTVEYLLMTLATDDTL